MSSRPSRCQVSLHLLFLHHLKCLQNLCLLICQRKTVELRRLRNGDNRYNSKNIAARISNCYTNFPFNLPAKRKDFILIQLGGPLMYVFKMYLHVRIADLWGPIHFICRKNAVSICMLSGAKKTRSVLNRSFPSCLLPLYWNKSSSFTCTSIFMHIKIIFIWMTLHENWRKRQFENGLFASSLTILIWKQYYNQNLQRGFFEFAAGF